jgi:hypothetical protein
MAKARDLDTSCFNLPGLIVGEALRFTGDSHGEPGELSLEMTFFIMGGLCVSDVGDSSVLFT